MVTATDIPENLAHIRARIAAAAARVGRDPSTVTLVAVSKRKPTADIRTAAAAGQHTFGENYVQELLSKYDELSDLPDIAWHYIGHLQRNKVRQVVGRVALLHAVDSERLLAEIDKRSRSAGVVTPVLLQVNISEEDTKSGSDETALPALARHAASLDGVALRGLMTMPPFFPNPEEARPFFRRLRALRDALVREHGVPAECLGELSMGMSNDFEVAIEEGATLVRVGSSIFGAREPLAR